MAKTELGRTAAAESAQIALAVTPIHPHGRSWSQGPWNDGGVQANGNRQGRISKGQQELRIAPKNSTRRHPISIDHRSSMNRYQGQVCRSRRTARVRPNA